MAGWLIKYGRYAPVVTGLLLIYSALERPRAGRKLSLRVVLGAMGVLLVYVTIYKLF